jgi:hypothetical protein
MWKKIAESTDLISFENRAKRLTVRLEARLNPDNSWVIFKRYFNNEGISYTEEYHANSKDEAYYLIDALKNKLLDRQEIEEARQSRKKGIKIAVRRTFKEYNIEKWEFSVDRDEFINFIYIRFEDKIGIDIVIHERYKLWEEQILAEVNAIFGLESTDVDIGLNIIFYSERFNKTHKGKRGEVFIGRIEMGINPGANPEEGEL